MPITWTAEAIGDLQSNRLYIADFNPAAAEGMARRLLDAAEGLVLFPARGDRVADNRRRLSTVPPYSIYYRLQQEQVVILRVLHDRQDVSAL
ncbi:MAG: type II toxin-antitoxin system RelE/ParE family toxin [Niveispirillum sp.]|uniref:type II toxin-antitoxin system RelE/ParE family toxin n=1 Tax=Niveispirillum sp. TaxID=1917217 RepID=UPI003BA68035